VFVVPLSAGRRPRRFDDVGRLLLAAEVLSPSTGRADRVTKRVLFRDESVPEYWVVDLDSRTIERSTPRDSRIERIDDRLEWQPEGAASALTIDVADYFARVLDD
jgi:Uma2 family endonuclease